MILFPSFALSFLSTTQTILSQNSTPPPPPAPPISHSRQFILLSPHQFFSPTTCGSSQVLFLLSSHCQWSPPIYFLFFSPIWVLVLIAPITSPLLLVTTNVLRRHRLKDFTDRHQLPSPPPVVTKNKYFRKPQQTLLAITSWVPWLNSSSKSIVTVRHWRIRETTKWGEP